MTHEEQERKRDEAFMALIRLCVYGVALPMAVIVVVLSWAGAR
jgi:hypothetical protein